MLLPLPPPPLVVVVVAKFELDNDEGDLHGVVALSPSGVAILPLTNFSFGSTPPAVAVVAEFGAASAFAPAATGASSLLPAPLRVARQLTLDWRG